jgi:hypothetical protein
LSWTLADELTGLAQGDELADSLTKIGLLDAGEALGSLDVIRDWYRSGAETYSLHFSVATSAGTRRQYMLKACVASPGSSSLAEVFSEWLKRRALLDALGISTPVLYATGRAVLVEEHIPYTLAEALGRAGDRIVLLAALGATAARLVGGGFVPLSAHDWRSRGTDVVLIDFGQDLGPANLTRGSEAGLLSEIIDRLSASYALSGTELQAIGAAYEEHLGS